MSSVRRPVEDVAGRKCFGETNQYRGRSAREEYPESPGDVVAGGVAPEFNDLPETRKKDVLDAFDRAIASVRR